MTSQEAVPASNPPTQQGNANNEAKEMSEKLEPPTLDESKRGGPVDNLPARQYLEQTVVPILLQVCMWAMMSWSSLFFTHILHMNPERVNVIPEI